MHRRKLSINGTLESHNKQSFGQTSMNNGSSGSQFATPVLEKLKQHDLEGKGFTSQRRRDHLIQQLQRLGISDQRILLVMRNMPRHLFLDEAMANRAYENCALPIGFGQTISQPYIVALMTELVLRVDEPNQLPKKVLEIGTGSGYQAAILSMLVDDVYTVERIKDLHLKTRRLLQRLQLRNIHCHLSDGNLGWQEQAPFDVIIVTAAAPEIAESLFAQLKIGGRLITPHDIEQTTKDDSSALQQLRVYTRHQDNVSFEVIEDVNFVPLLPGTV